MTYVDSETISRLIIDKLISNVIIENKLKDVDLLFNIHIEKFIFELITPLMQSEFIFHENGLDKIEEDIFHYKENKISKINTWLTIPEPKTCEGDRFSSNIKLIKLKLQKNDKNNIILDNSLKELESEHNIKNSDIIKKNKQKKKYRNKISKRNILIKKENISTNSSKNSKDKKKEPILEIPGTYIPLNSKEKINILLNDTEENNNLRKEWQLYLIEKEKKEFQERLKLKNARAKLLINKEFKLINTNELTFDSDGNILKLNKPKENLFQNGFISSKSSLKKNKIEETTPLQTTTQLIKKPNNSNNKIKLTKLNLEDINNNNEIVEYNLDEQIRFKSEFNIYKNLNKYYKGKNNTEKVIVSGSNYDKMEPEIGVVISSPEKEKEKKIGGFNYIKKYNRPSMNELNEYLSNYTNDMSSNYNNSNSKIASFLYSYSNKSNNSNNYIGYKEHFNDERNPLFQNAFNLNDRKSRNLLLKREIGNKKSLSNENIFRTNKIIKKGKSYNNIILLKDEQNFNGKDINSNYLSSVNNIFLSNKFNFPNLKILFSEENENYLNTDMNKNDTKNLGNIKVMKENKSNLIYSIKDIRKGNKNFLPNINADKNKNILGKDYINKFLINTIQKRNLSYGNLENINDINKENSYKNQFLKIKKNNNKNVN